MSRAFNEADRVAKLVALSGSPNEHEAASAREKAIATLQDIDLAYLETLAGQRERLLKDMRAESHRLMYGGRATKRDTGDLVDRSMMLFRHYQRADALISAVELLRSHELTHKPPPTTTRGSTAHAGTFQ